MRCCNLGMNRLVSLFPGDRGNVVDLRGWGKG
jgi:hypothetical protein